MISLVKFVWKTGVELSLSNTLSISLLANKLFFWRLVWNATFTNYFSLAALPIVNKSISFWQRVNRAVFLFLILAIHILYLLWVSNSSWNTLWHFLLFIIFYIFVLKVTKTLYYMFMLNRLQTKCLHVIVFKRIASHYRAWPIMWCLHLMQATTITTTTTTTTTCSNMKNCFIHSNSFYF